MHKHVEVSMHKHGEVSMHKQSASLRISTLTAIKTALFTVWSFQTTGRITWKLHLNFNVLFQRGEARTMEDTQLIPAKSPLQNVYKHSTPTSATNDSANDLVATLD